MQNVMAECLEKIQCTQVFGHLSCSKEYVARLINAHVLYMYINAHPSLQASIIIIIAVFLFILFLTFMIHISYNAQYIER